MVRAFYPIASAAALRRAYEERREYFAGGVLIGTGGDAFRLPDGTVIDAIKNVSGGPGVAEWQILVNPTGGGGAGYELEPGPLAALDPLWPDPTPNDRGFESIVVGALAELAGIDGAIDDQAHAIAGELAAANQDDTGAVELDQARHDLEQQISAFDALNPAEGIQTTLGLSHQPADNSGELPDPADEPETIPGRAIPRIPDSNPPTDGSRPSDLGDW